MRDARLRKLFKRYHERGDVEALTTVFNTTAPGLMSLARYLVARPENAEDAVQATFLAAIEQAGKYDAGLPLQPWLTGILVRKARQVGGRRPLEIEVDRADASAPSDPAQGASNAEFKEELKRALANLDERYRRVLLPFLQEGDPPREIAERLGVAAGTVRVRIHRGLKLLRKALPAGYALGGSVAIVSPAVLERMRTTVEGAAQSAAQASGPALANPSPAVASWAGPRALAAASALALSGTGAWWLAGEGASPEEGRAGALADMGDAPSLEVSPTPGAALVETEVAHATERVQVAAASGAIEQPRGAWTLRAEVSGLGSFVPRDLRLKITDARASGVPRTVAIRGDGLLVVELEELGAGEAVPVLTLEVIHDAYAPFALETSAADARAAGELAVGVHLVCRANLYFGRVSATEAVAPRVAFYPEGEGDRPLGRPTTATCSTDGSFHLWVRSGSGWFVAAADGCAPFGERIDRPVPMEVDMGTIELDEGAFIAGVAYSQGRAPAEPGRLTVNNMVTEDAPRASLGKTSLGFLADGIATDSATVRPDADGHFRVRGLTPGRYGVLHVPVTRASGYSSPRKQGIQVEAPIEGLELDSPIRVYTIQVLCAGQPVSDATVHYHLPGGSSVSGPSAIDGRYAFFMANSDARHRVEVSKPGFSARELLIGPLDFDGDRSLQVELARTAPASELTLNFEVAHGPIGRLGLRLRLADSEWSIYRAPGPTGATMALGEVPAGRYSLEVWPEVDRALEPRLQGSWLKTELEVACAPSAFEVAPVHLTSGGRAVFHVQGFGEGGAGSWLLRGPGSEGSLGLITWDANERELVTIHTPHVIGRDGEYWLSRALLPGEYSLELIVAGESRSVPFFVSAGSATDVLLER